MKLARSINVNKMIGCNHLQGSVCRSGRILYKLGIKNPVDFELDLMLSKDFKNPVVFALNCKIFNITIPGDHFFIFAGDHLNTWVSFTVLGNA